MDDPEMTPESASIFDFTRRRWDISLTGGNPGRAVPFYVMPMVTKSSSPAIPRESSFYSFRERSRQRNDIRFHCPPEKSQFRVRSGKSCGTGSECRRPLPPLPDLNATRKDLASVQARFAGMKVAHRHPYLEQERGIPASTQQHWRFGGLIKVDRYG